MRTLQVQFTSGREVLGHYWGLLSGGGLSLEQQDLEELSDGAAAVGLTEGVGFLPDEIFRLRVHVRSVKKAYELEVQVLDQRVSTDGRQVVVAFLPHSRPDDLLDAAWADGCDSPQRRFRRLPLQLEVRYDRLDGRERGGRLGRLLNLSSGGCCVEGAGLPPPGTQVLLTTVPRGPVAEQVQLMGRVRWTERPEAGMMGIEFLGAPPDLPKLMQGAQLQLTPPHGTPRKT